MQHNTSKPAPSPKQAAFDAPRAMSAASAAPRMALGDQPPPRPMRLIGWKPLERSSLRGFATVELPMGLKIVDCPVLMSNGKVWAALPSKPQIGEDGQQRRDAGGKSALSPVVQWRNRDLAGRWSDAVVALVRAAHPEVFE